MNWQHFRTFVWLQWRIRRNQLRRGGSGNVIVLAILAVLAVVVAAGGFVLAFLIGAFALAKAQPAFVMLAWDALAGAFLFFWLMGIMQELQRAEAFSLDKFLHLPVSLSSAFLINYLVSLVSPCLVIFLPVMIGLTIGLAVGRGPVMLGVLPLVAAFVLMVTALTYQFQGWLAALMVNKRRRRTVVVVATMAIVLIAQLPQLINFAGPWNNRQPVASVQRQIEERVALEDALRTGKIDQLEFRRRMEDSIVVTRLRRTKTGKCFDNSSKRRHSPTLSYRRVGCRWARAVWRRATFWPQVSARSAWRSSAPPACGDRTERPCGSTPAN
ncbi:MAG TPA: hypothetical protein VL371_22065 [Gemmataceae bacterium]|nr:hypothetical protein [Gemmataceae bacterium]